MPRGTLSELLDHVADVQQTFSQPPLHTPSTLWSMLEYVTAHKIFSIFKNVFNCHKISPFYGEIKPNFPSWTRQMEKLRLNVN